VTPLAEACADPCRASRRVGCPDESTVLVCHQPNRHPGDHYDASEHMWWQWAELADEPPLAISIQVKDPAHFGREIMRVLRAYEAAAKIPIMDKLPEWEADLLHQQGREMVIADAAAILRDPASDRMQWLTLGYPSGEALAHYLEQDANDRLRVAVADQIVKKARK